MEPQRWDVLQQLIRAFDLPSYLEIGYGRGDCLYEISCRSKLAVDPNIDHPLVIQQTSTKFFEQNDHPFGLIYVDGAKDYETVMSDIQQALQHTTEKGIVAVGGPNRPAERGAEDWYGDVWAAWLDLRRTVEDRTMFVVDVPPYGVGVMMSGLPTPFFSHQTSLEEFQRHKREWLPLVDYRDLNLILSV